jgi:hypothetical protein
MTSDAPDDTSLPGLWETAKYFMRWLYAVCGSPCALIAEPHLSRKDRKNIIFWLRPIEAIVRRLLVAEAARMAQKPRAAKPKIRGGIKPPGAPSRPGALPDLDDSTRWSVRFCLPGSARPAAATLTGPRILVLDPVLPPLAHLHLARAAERFRRARNEARGEKPSCVKGDIWRVPRAAGNPWKLARRIEALTRVLENPRPYARRLARRLEKDSARIAAACSPPPPRQPGRRPHYGDASVRAASELARAALAPFDTS